MLISGRRCWCKCQKTAVNGVEVLFMHPDAVNGDKENGFKERATSLNRDLAPEGVFSRFDGT